MAEKLLFVTGMQKSGTSLLNRLLMAQDFIENPFLPEGKFFWGDNPVNDPTESPCGALYQKHSGIKGHQLLSEDFTLEHQKLLTHRIEEAKIKALVLMNKNPNLIVRLPWLKKVFPESKIVVVLRDPVANIYSLSKKSHNEKQKDSNFWWGVKPEKWQSLIDPNPLIQIVNQWKSVFRFVLSHIECIDSFVFYKSLCERPESSLNQITELMGVNAVQYTLPFSKLTCMDEEFQIGGDLESKNILLRRDKTFEISDSELQKKTYRPFTKYEVSFIQKETSDLWEQLKRKMDLS